MCVCVCSKKREASILANSGNVTAALSPALFSLAAASHTGLEHVKCLIQTDVCCICKTHRLQRLRMEKNVK